METDDERGQYFRSFTQAAKEEGSVIRSAVIKAATRDEATGLHCFDTAVLTPTFTLPWDLDPRVKPTSLSVSRRDERRIELVDLVAQGELEAVRALGHTWKVPTRWQRLEEQPDRSWRWVSLPDELHSALESYYFSDQVKLKGPGNRFAVDLAEGSLLDAQGNVHKIDRLGLATLAALKTQTDDIRSLLNAVSLALWGVHDKTHVLETALLASLEDPRSSLLIKRRYELELERFQPSVPATAQVWELSKKHIKECPQLHLFVLSNVLKRPIVVYSDHEANHVRGIYLPLIWEDVTGSFPGAQEPLLRNPLVLGYSDTRKHFCPLVTFQPDGHFRDPSVAARVPLTNSAGALLPVRFLSATQAGNVSDLLKTAMSTEVMTHSRAEVKSPPLFGSPPAFGADVDAQMVARVEYDIACARLTMEPLPEAIAALQAKRTLAAAPFDDAVVFS